MPCISCRSIFESQSQSTHLRNILEKVWEKVTGSLCFPSPAINIFCLSTLQSCFFCLSSCCCCCSFSWAMASSVFYHKSCTILSYKLALHWERKSGSSLVPYPHTTSLIYDRPTWFIILSLCISLLFSLSLPLYVCPCCCRDWQRLVGYCEWSSYSQLLARLSTNDWGQFLMSAELGCSLPHTPSLSLSLSIFVFLFALFPVIAGNFA